MEQSEGGVRGMDREREVSRTYKAREGSEGRTERGRGRGTDRARGQKDGQSDGGVGDVQREGGVRGMDREREGSGGRIERRRGHRGDRDMWTQRDTREKTKVTNQNILC